MRTLLQGVLQFRKVIRPSLLPTLRQVADRISPKFALVTCIDCRMMPSLYLDASPGDMFVVRTAGNLLPHAKLFGQQVSTSGSIAGLEMAIEVGKVDHVIVCGHSDCKAMQCLHLDSSKSNNSYQRWIKKHGASSLTRFERLELSQDTGVKLVFDDPQNASEVMEAVIDEENKLSTLDKLSQVNVLQQLHNLKSFGFIRQRLNNASLRLHGLWFDIREGEMYVYSKECKKFVVINEETVGTLSKEM